MRKLILLTIILGHCLTVNAFADTQALDVYGGFDEEFNYWYLLDYDGNYLEDGDCVCAYWVGPNGVVNGIDVFDPPEPLDDDVKLVCGTIEYGIFFINVSTFQSGSVNHPQVGENIYAVIFDAPCDELGPDNYYGMSQLHLVENVQGEVFYCLFPNDPDSGYTDTPLPVELVSFTATGRDGEVLLEWVTASEQEAFGFHIHRDGHRITGEIIPAAGNSTVENTYTYIDTQVENGVTYAYNLIAVDIDGVENMVNENPVLVTPSITVPQTFSLYQNYPNPFNPKTEIRYDLAEEAPVSLKIYNVLGSEVVTLVDAFQKAGAYSVSWSAQETASGIYFCSLTAGEFKAVKKMVYLK